MLAHSSLSRFPRVLFLWITVEGAHTPDTPFSSTKKTSRTHETRNEGSFSIKKVFFYP